MKNVSWIEHELLKHFPRTDIRKGIDLNRNGRIDDAECPDPNGDGAVDIAEWRTFLDRHRQAFLQLGGYFRIAIQSRKWLSLDNPLHDLLALESEVSSPRSIIKASALALKTLGIARIILEKHAKATPQQKLKIVFEVIAHLMMKKGSAVLLSQGAERGILDCDTTSMLVLTVAHEFGWPVYLVSVPNHAFIRWDDGAGTRFNMDFGAIHSDAAYLKKFGISQASVDRGVYLRNLDRTGLLSSFHRLVGTAFDSQGKYEDAVRHFTQAIHLDPRNFAAFVDRGNAKRELRQDASALQDFAAAMAMAPERGEPHVSRANLFMKRGRMRDAFADIERAIALHTKGHKIHLADAYAERGKAYYRLGNLQKALSDFKKAISLNPTNAEALNNHGVIMMQLGRNDEALANFNKAIEEEPELAAYYANRGIALRVLKRPREALRDHNKAISKEPTNGMFYNDRALAYLALGKLRLAKADLRIATARAPGSTNAWINRIAFGFIPDPFYTTIQPRIAASGEKTPEARTSLGASWPLFELGDLVSLGPKLELGYASQGKPNHLDLSGGTALTVRTRQWLFDLHAGAGYNFRVTGNDLASPLRHGGFFAYGSSLSYRITDDLSLGIAIALQHEMRDPSHAAVLPGIELSYAPWR